MTRTCSSCQAANRAAARYCKHCGVALAPSEFDPTAGLVGLGEVRATIARLRTAMEAVRRDGLTYSDRLHSILIGNTGTGKTRLVHALTDLYCRFGVTKSAAPIICDAVDFADFSRNFQDNFRKAKGHVLCIENVQKLIPAGYAERIEPIDRLIAEMSKPTNRLDPIIVLSGQPQRLREYLGANDGVKSQFPFVFTLPDFTAAELTELAEAELTKSAFTLADTARDKLIRVFKRILKNNRTPGSAIDGSNAWAAVKVAETLKINHLIGATAGGNSSRIISTEDVTLPSEDEPSVEEILKNLDEFEGMHDLKQAARSLIDEVSVQKARVKAGIGKHASVAFHIVLTGNPGTGKTSVARILGQLFRAAGVLELGHVIETDRSNMVAAYVGQTAIQVNEICDRAQGCVLFIDEAYTLKQKESDSFGQEAIDTLLKRMEDDRGRFVVVVAGYPKEILTLLNSNPGLQSRFDERYRFHLEDYTPDELVSIFRKLAAKDQYQLDPSAAELVRKHLVNRCAQKDRNFGNGREARALLEACRSRQSKRLAHLAASRTPTHDDLTSILADDVPAGPQPKDLPAVLDELNRLTGLRAVKDELRGLFNYMQAERMRAERGGTQTRLNLHFVFRGNPGTGKTTVARILCEALKSLGLLSKGTLTEVDRSGLVGQYVGDTEVKVNAAVDGAMGGVLFVDEAYGLIGDSFGQKAIDTLLKRMEDDRGKFVVIAAGYTREMSDFLNSNPGLSSRFTKFIDFDDYKPDELTDIYRSLVAKKGMTLDPSAAARATALFEDVYATRDPSFANGRAVRNIFEKTLQNQAARLAPATAAGTIDEAGLNTITALDITR